MTMKLKVRVLFLSAVLFLVSGRSIAMDSGTSTGSQKNSSWNFSSYTNYLKQWGPTMLVAAGAAFHWGKDHQAHYNALSWIKETWQETPSAIKYPAALLGSCMVFEYYKPRFSPVLNTTWNYLKTKAGYLQN